MRKVKLKDLVILFLNGKKMEKDKLICGVFILARAMGKRTRLSDVRRVVNRMIKEEVIEVEHAGNKGR